LTARLATTQWIVQIAESDFSPKQSRIPDAGNRSSRSADEPATLPDPATLAGAQLQEYGMMKRPILVAIALVPFVLGTAACQHQGPAERAGTKLDQAGRDVGDSLNSPKGPAQSTGRSIDRALGQ